MQGDGGSPLVCPIEGRENQYEQAGIVSWGIGCGEVHVPGVYANVALFRDWIDEKMHSLGYKVDTYTGGLNLRFGPVNATESDDDAVRFID